GCDRHYRMGAWGHATAVKIVDGYSVWRIGGPAQKIGFHEEVHPTHIAGAARDGCQKSNGQAVSEVKIFHWLIEHQCWRTVRKSQDGNCPRIEAIDFAVVEPIDQINKKSCLGVGVRKRIRSYKNWALKLTSIVFQLVGKTKSRIFRDPRNSITNLNS